MLAVCGGATLLHCRECVMLAGKICTAAGRVHVYVCSLADLS